MKTTADLRTILSEAMDEVKAGTLETDPALTLVRLATQINESFYAEVKVARAVAELGKVNGKVVKIGSLNLGQQK